jgi:sugar phosphate isomerase/epimerase
MNDRRIEPMRLSRRTLLGRASLGACGILGLGQSLAAPNACQAIDVIQRPGPHKFKLSMAAYGYRDLLTGDSPPWTLETFIHECAKLNLDATELTSYYFPESPSDEYLIGLRSLCFRLGLDVSGTAVGNDFCHPPGEQRDKQIADVKTWIERADKIGAPIIRIFSGHPHGTSEQEAHKLAVAAIEECCDYAGQYGIYLALENHGGLTERPEGLLSLVHDVKSPWFAVNLDTGNFHGEDVYADLAQLAPYAMNVQIKVVISPASGKREPADMRRLAAILRDVGYRGYIVLEYEEKEDPRTACPRYVEQLREAFV